MSTQPKLDPTFEPIASRLDTTSGEPPITFVTSRPDGTRSRFELSPRTDLTPPARTQLIERTLKSLLWAHGANHVDLAGADAELPSLSAAYAPDGTRAFDAAFIEKVYGTPLTLRACAPADLPEEHTGAIPLGRHLSGNRIGFDLGGSDRKCAAVVDGKVVHSEEISWDPYFQTDPDYHRAGIADSIRRAADALPSVDAIGGSSAGVYVDSVPRSASLFRGVAPADLPRVENVFHDIAAEYNVPIQVINDGDVTALAGAMHLGDNAVLGIAMGTSEAVGYVDPAGHITGWLNELAFVPLDLQPGAPTDEWSRDDGVGANYLSQQAVARLIAPADLTADVDTTLPYPEQLLAVQARMADGDERAADLYETIGAYLAHAIDWYRHLYDIRHVLLLGRVLSGEGGEIILREAQRILPQLGVIAELHTPDEKFKRHGQAIAAASLPAI